MKIIGAGFARTGTVSLTAALQRLGVRHCLHPLEPSAEPGFGERHLGCGIGSLQDLAGLDGVFGWLGARHYHKFLELWPEARVLLSVRDPDAWYASYASCLEHTRRAGGRMAAGRG